MGNYGILVSAQGWPQRVADTAHVTLDLRSYAATRINANSLSY